MRNGFHLSRSSRIGTVTRLFHASPIFREEPESAAVRPIYHRPPRLIIPAEPLGGVARTAGRFRRRFVLPLHKAPYEEAP